MELPLSHLLLRPTWHRTALPLLCPLWDQMAYLTTTVERFLHLPRCSDNVG